MGRNGGVSAVLVTRGDVDMAPILETLPYDDIVVWDNSERDDLGIYGRYAAIEEAKHDLIYTQDDDLLFTEHDALLDVYQGEPVFNSEPGKDIPWCARGALFHRDVPKQAFDRYLAVHPFDHMFTHYGCDVVFALLTPVRRVWFGTTDLPYCEDPGRVSTSPGWWGGKRDEMVRRCVSLS